MKSLDDIRSEFFDQRGEKDSTLLAAVYEAGAEKDALLQRAGIKDEPDDLFGDDAEKWKDEACYRRHVRELVFTVSDREWRCQIMSKINAYRYQL
jgi:hypothetical protein